jgi:hypothetical protein
MMQTTQVYRGALRNAFLCVAFTFGAAIFTSFTYFAAVTRQSVAAMVGFGLVALLLLYVAVRAALMKAVATQEGLTLQGPLHTFSVPWARIAGIKGANTETDGVLPVRAPVLVLANGRRIKIRMVSSYTFSIGDRANSRADQVATELESLRLAHSL